MQISIIIPIYQEPFSVIKTLTDFIDTTPGENLEWITVSTADTKLDELSSHPQIKFLIAEKGRARQMNAGAKIATGQTLVFLHADTILEQGWLTELRNSTAKSNQYWGAFTPEINQKGWLMALAKTWGAWRSRVLAYPYGDQTIYISRTLFLKLGGYKEEDDFMEELELARRLKRKGLKPKILNAKAITSSRRWQAHGGLRYSLGNLLLFACFLLGISPRLLKQLAYRYFLR